MRVVKSVKKNSDCYSNVIMHLPNTNNVRGQSCSTRATTDTQGRSQTWYTAPCNAIVSHGARIGFLRVCVAGKNPNTPNLSPILGSKWCRFWNLPWISVYIFFFFLLPLLVLTSCVWVLSHWVQTSCTYFTLEPRVAECIFSTVNRTWMIPCAFRIVCDVL